MWQRAVFATAGVAAVLGVVASLAATPAQAASPWFRLTSGARPTHLKAGVAKNEVQAYTVSPSTGGEYALIREEVGHEAFGFVPFDASLEKVQEVLAEMYGAGNVEVTGGSPLPSEARTYTITFIGELSDIRVKPIIAFPFALEPESALHEGPLEELTEGRPDGQVILTVSNLGDASANGEVDPIEIADELPAGLKATSIEGLAGMRAAYPPLNCALETLTCRFPHILPNYTQVEVRIDVLVQGAESGEENKVSVSGGGAPAASASRPIAISGNPAPFGAEDYDLTLEEEGGAPATHAGSHPFQVTGSIFLNQSSGGKNPVTTNVEAQPVALAKNVNFKLPAGFIGNPSPFARCTLSQFSTETCPASSVLGVAIVDFNEPRVLGLATFTVPLYNLEPAFGEPARFGFLPTRETPVFLQTSLRDGNGEDYGVTVSSINTLQTVAFLSSEVTFWGTPGDPRHDNSRGYGCLEESRYLASGNFPPTRPCDPLAELHPRPFQTLPTDCSGTPLATSVSLDSWTRPGLFETLAGDPMPTLDGCNQLPFSPTIHSEPTSNAATSPTGLEFNLNFNDEGLSNSNPGARAQSQMKKVVVTLPQGFTTNPSVAEGLKACSQAEYEASTLQVGSGCTTESKIGDVEIESPLVKSSQIVKGGLYVAKQKDNPNNNLLTLYLVAREPEIGVLVKQALKVTPDPVTGQLTTEVDNIPQLPFNRFRLAFRQGQRSPLITPPACGTYTVNAELYPWSEPASPVHRESSFQITEGPEGNPCPSGGLPPFHPGLEAGSQNNAAGHYSPFYIHMTRRDSEQEITHFSIKLPPGVLGKLAGIPFCSDAQVAAAKAREHEGGGSEELNSPSCPAASEIGRTLVGTGVGNVLAYAPGKVYLAGPYHGSAISVAAITAGVVGPFDLGTVVVREALRVNPETGEVFVDATGSDPIPHIVDGIATHLRDIRVYMDRPEFVLNPTGCEPTSTASTLLGAGLDFSSEADDRPVTVSSPFQAADCAALAFKPRLSLKLKGGTRRGAHPAFHALLRMKGTGESNIKRAQVTLPKSEFLENAHIKTICTRVQFRAQKCPAESIYGHASAKTPILSEPLSGPVYLRSSEHQLPDLVAVLKNGEIEVDLVGRVDSLGGRIRNTFEAAPDAPVETFALDMQGAKKGLLVNSTDVCKGTHRAIADFTAHNGKELDFNPPLQANCPKARKAHKQKHRAG
jgi:hypothetical protein